MRLYFRKLILILFAGLCLLFAGLGALFIGILFILLSPLLVYFATDNGISIRYKSMGV